MRKQIEAIAQDFEWKLFSTGEELALHKCYWYLVEWRWDPDGTPRIAIFEEAQGEMKLTKGYELSRELIQRLECTDSQRTIGVKISPSGEQGTQFRHVMKQTRTFSKKLA